MENYIVSARKYRPATFRSVVGQETLTTTLKNAIETHHLAHAYLFCGPRGVGKTTCARIFAKTINCMNPTAEGEACNECDSCKAFNEQRSFNIHELDAASNNSVDDIRNLTDQVRIPPQVGKYSVYIIDEVHMLSQAAFNAFLKTLEEPPSHAIFILATTEKQKVLATILSRCQIYDFNRIGINDIVGHLQYVAESEGVKAEREALTVIAKKADGGMRDALSIFDQVVSFCGSEVTYKQVIADLNVLDYEYYFQLIDLFKAGNVGQALVVFDEILNKGFDPQNFVQGLALHFRDLMTSKDEVTVKLMEVGDDVRNRYVEQAKSSTLTFLYNGMMLANECDKEFKQSRNKRLLVELLLIRLCQLMQPLEGGVEKKKPELKPLSVEASVVTAASTPATSTVASVPDSAPKFAQTPTSTPVQTPISTQKVETAAPVAEAAPKMQRTFTKLGEFKLGDNKPKNEVEIQVTAAAEQVDAAAHNNQEYSEEQLHDAWEEFANGIQKNIKLAVTLRTSKPKLEEGNKYLLELVNPGQKNDVDKVLPKLVEFLREKLQNNTIEITTRVVEGEFHKKAFTPRERLDEMLEEYPEVKDFCERLDLRLM